ncbi:MAG: DUF885 domain-containing protein, partial [Acidimicrobiales bacterium]
AGLAADHPPTPEAMRAEYAEWVARARQFLVGTDLVSLPDGEGCLVEPSPPFARSVDAVASYRAPPPFTASRTGHFFVPYPADGMNDDEVRNRLASNARPAMPTVTAHEAYPGHHWHHAMVAGNPRPLRRVLGTPFFWEGWALYAEAVMAEHGFFTDPRHRLCHLEARAFRAVRMVVDTGLHTGEMGFDEAVDHLSAHTSVTGATARAEVGRYCQRPTQAVSYLTGALEIGRIRRRWEAEERGSLRQFHDALAGSGSLPPALAAAAVLT